MIGRFLSFAKKTKVLWWLIGLVVVLGALVVYLTKRVLVLNRRVALALRLGKAQAEYTSWVNKSHDATASKKRKANEEFKETHEQLQKKREEIRRAKENGNASLAATFNKYFGADG